MKSSVLAVVAFGFVGLLGCSRNNIEAVNRANEGDKARSSGSIDEAISKYEQGVRLDPTNHRIFWKMAQAHLKKPDWEKVADACKGAARAAETGSKNKVIHANYYNLQGHALRMLAEKGKAQWADVKGPLETAIKADPNIADAYVDLAEANLFLDEEQQALQNLTTAIEKRPTSVGFFGYLADLYLDLGLNDQAEAVLNEGLSFASQATGEAEEVSNAKFILHSMLGQVKQNKGDTGAAMQKYKEAKTACGECRKPGQAVAYYNIGFVNFTSGNKDEAILNLKNFHKIAGCKAGKATYKFECDMTTSIVSKLGGVLN